MVNRLRNVVTISAALALAACSNGCNNISPSAPAGPDQHETRSVDLDKSEQVRAELKMGSGELDIQGGAQKLMDADFTYNVAAWKPDLRYSSTGGSGNLILEQPGSNGSSGGNTKNRWELRFNNQVPLDLRVECGAGEAQLNLGTLDLRGVNVQMGAGTMRLDLRGKPTRDYSVRVRGGVGEATVYVPKDVGISASVSGGLGEITVSGLHKSGDVYVNDTSQTSKATIHLDITGGIGSVKLIAE